MTTATTFKTDCCSILGGKVFIGLYRPPTFAGPATTTRPLYPIQNRDLGEVADAQITQELETKERMSHRSPAGGLACSSTRIKKASLKLKVDCTSAENRALAMLGLFKEIGAGAVVLEEARVLRNPAGSSATLVDLQFLIDDTQTVLVMPGAVVGGGAYVLGRDYIIENGHLLVLDTGNIPVPVAPAFEANIRVSYTRRKQVQIESSLAPDRPLVITFAGFSMGGSQGVVPFQAGIRYAKVKPTAIDLITDDFDQFELEFDLLPDPALTSSSQYSPYFWGFFGAQ